MAQIRLGFIGAGFVARFHATALHSVRGVELAAVTRHAASPALSEHAQRLGVGPCRIVDSVDELCRACDVVAILAPNFARVDVMEQIADAVPGGAELKGIMCEKPLGRTVAEARRLVELARQIELPTAYLENQLHMKAIKAARAQLAPVAETMGPPVLARSSEEHAGPHHGWFWDPTRQGGGALCDLACHSIAIGWYVLTPPGRDPVFLEPVNISAETSLLKWGQPRYRAELLDRMGVDYAATPAEDYCSGIVTFRNPESGQIVKAQFSNSWMYDKQGLRLTMDGLGPGYAFEVNSLRSPLEVFVADDAATAVADAETALEKSTASRGLLAVAPNEADLYGYNDELDEAAHALAAGRDAMLNWDYGLAVTRLCQAAYLSAERRAVVDLTDPATDETLASYQSLIAQGRGTEILMR